MNDQSRVPYVTPDARKKLCAMYKLEYQPREDGGMPFNLDDHLWQTKCFLDLDISPEEQATALDVTLSYVLALRNAIQEGSLDKGTKYE